MPTEGGKKEDEESGRRKKIRAVSIYWILGVLAVVLLVSVILVASLLHQGTEVGEQGREDEPAWFTASFLATTTPTPPCYDPTKDTDNRGNVHNLSPCRKSFIGGGTETGDCPEGYIKDFSGVCQRAFLFDQ